METIKPQNVKMITFNIKPDNSNVIYGLGDDGMIYMWNPHNHEWILWDILRT